MNTIEEEVVKINNLCETNLKTVSPIMLRHILKYTENVPQFIKAVIIFGSSAEIGFYHPGSDIDLILVIDDYEDLFDNKDVLKEYENRVHDINTDIVIEDYKGLVEAMNNGDSLNYFYKTIWEEGKLIYCSEELVRRKCDERINKR